MSSRRRRNRQERVTLLDVATAAGVSSITVSRALRQPEKVSQGLRESIIKLVDEMGYVPDFAARALASENNGIIGVLVPALANYVFLGAMRGIEDRVRATDFRIQYANTHFDPGEEIHQLKLFLGQNPAGLVIAGVETHQDVWGLLKRAACPVVQIMDTGDAPVHMAVGINHKAAAITATRHLIDRGYRRIGLLGGSVDIRGERRLQGYRTVMEENGLFDPALVIAADGQTSVAFGCHLLARLLNTVPDADAVFCHNDDVALGALFECQRRGIRVPEDFGICGFNDLDFASVAYPALTSVRVPRYDIGYRAVDMIMRAAAKEWVPTTAVDLGYQFMERQTTRHSVV
ncbi:MAG: LacI family DNA-binding transcriptional regulator [Allorhizobium sp.]